MNFHIGRRLAVAVVAVLLLVGVAGCSGSSGSSEGTSDDAPTVAFLLPENVNPRWEQQDAPFLEEALQERNPNIELIVSNANNDAAAQQRQAEQALTQGAEVLVVIPVDGQAASAITATASQSQVPVVAYDRMIQSDNVAAWVQADMVSVGREQAEWLVDKTELGDTIIQIKGSPTDTNARLFDKGYQDVLGPLYENDERVLGYDTWTQGWDPAKARVSVDQALTKLNNDVDGILASNDGNAAAAIAALEEQQLAGQVPVTGLDGTVQALQLMLQGKQGMTVWRPFDEMGERTAEIVFALLQDEDVTEIATTSVTNEVGASVPHAETSYYVAVDEEGIQYIIDNDPSIEREEVCEGATADTDFCQQN